MKWEKYNDIRDSIVTGDIYFTKAKSILGIIVNFFTSSYIPHVGMFMVIGNRVFCVEINVFGKVSMYLASEFLEKKKILHINTNRDVDEFEVLKDLGKVKYNYAGAILAPVYRFKNKRKNCAEWVSEKLRIDFPHLKRGIYPSDILSMFTDNVL